MGTKNISLPPDLEAYVEAKVDSGEYAHASEVVRDGLRLLMQQEAEKLEWLRNAVAEGLACAEEDDIPDADIVDEVKRRGRELLAARRRPQG